MKINAMHFTVEQVKAWRAFYDESRRSAKGKPEYGNYDTALKLCEQLLALMDPEKKPQPQEARTALPH
jgi:hypothetical protein